MRDHEVEWRRSHIKVLRSTIDGHLLPYFGDMQVGRITKADMLAFRTRLASLPGRSSKPGLSNKRINGILAPLRQMLNEAAEVHAFVSPFASSDGKVTQTGLGLEWPDRFKAGISRVTAADVRRVATTYMDPATFSSVIVGK